MFRGRYVGSVALTDEVRRIAALPRGEWCQRPDLDALVEKWTNALKTPDGTMTLRPHQAAFCEYLHTDQGPVGAVPVGEGKTLPTYLAPTITGAKRALLFVPFTLVTKTQRDFAKLARHWRPWPGEYRILNYEMFSTKRCRNFMREYKPDLVIADEADAFKDTTTARTSRLIEYLCDEEGVRYVPLSGTFMSASLMDYHHQLMLALGADRMPMPLDHVEAATWAYAVDREPPVRYNPGALVELEPGQHTHRLTVNEARQIIERRIHETPGVIRLATTSCPASIQLEVLRPKLPQKLRDMIRQSLDAKVDPEGQDLTPSTATALASTLATGGFYYYPDPPPPESYRVARRDWARFAFDVLETTPALDTEGLIKDAVRREDIQDYGLLARWDAAQAAYDGVKRTRWVDPDYPVEITQRALKAGPTLIWTHYQSLGLRLEEALGLSFYRKQGLDSKRRFIEDAPKGSSAVVAIKSCYRGLNLQHKWSRNLVMNLFVSWDVWEQMIGRTHRDGQLASTVYVSVLANHAILERQLGKAFEDAEAQEHLSKCPQKLLMADLVNL